MNHLRASLPFAKIDGHRGEARIDELSVGDVVVTHNGHIEPGLETDRAQTDDRTDGRDVVVADDRGWGGLQFQRLDDAAAPSSRVGGQGNSRDGSKGSLWMSRAAR